MRTTLIVLLACVFVVLGFAGIASAQCSDPCRPGNIGRYPDGSVITYVPDASMTSDYWNSFVTAMNLWNEEIGAQSANLELVQGPGPNQFNVYMDPTLPWNTAGQVDFNAMTLALNPHDLDIGGLQYLEEVMTHEIGHTLLLADVYTNGCDSQTSMYWQSSPDYSPGYPTSADGCTINHIYTLRDESPIILSLSKRYPELTAPDVWFDLANCGTPQLLSWTRPDVIEGFLVLDRNGDGVISNGSEMFGNYTPIPGTLAIAANGFQALGAYDLAQNGGDEDGWITPNDAVFESLRIWMDSDHDGVSAPSELKSLRSLGIIAISVNARKSGRRDRYGNTFQFESDFEYVDSSGRIITHSAVDVFLVRQ